MRNYDRYSDEYLQSLPQAELMKLAEEMTRESATLTEPAEKAADVARRAAEWAKFKGLDS
ncbi:MAG: hypothetical protein ACPG4X_14555 [Pikeienuella sp.]